MCGQDIRVGNNLNNIIGVQRLEINGGDTFEDMHYEKMSKIYCRVKDAQDTMYNNIKVKKLLFTNC